MFIAVKREGDKKTILELMQTHQVNIGHDNICPAGHCGMVVTDEVMPNIVLYYSGTILETNFCVLLLAICLLVILKMSKRMNEWYRYSATYSTGARESIPLSSYATRYCLCSACATGMLLYLLIESSEGDLVRERRVHECEEHCDADSNK